MRDIAWKAQIRLCARYRRLSATGKKLPIVVAAIAREMAAFLWAIGREVAPTYRRRGLAIPLPRAGSGARKWGTPVARLVAELMPDARPLDRGKPRDEDTEGGAQPADKSLINRRLSLHPQPCAASSRLYCKTAEQAVQTRLQS